MLPSWFHTSVPFMFITQNIPVERSKKSFKSQIHQIFKVIPFQNRLVIFVIF